VILIYRATSRTQRCLPPTQILAKMSVPKPDSVYEKSGHSSSAPHADVEIGDVGIVEEASRDGDEALHFLKNQHNVGQLTAEDETKLVRKIDWMIMPLMWCCYCLQYLDKTLGKRLN
jgi:hypothetical protein